MEYQIYVNYLMQNYPIAYYGAFATLTGVASFLILWGFNVLIDGLINNFIKLLKPAAVVCSVLAATFILFCLFIILQKNSDINQESFEAKRGAIKSQQDDTVHVLVSPKMTDAPSDAHLPSPVPPDAPTPDSIPTPVPTPTPTPPEPSHATEFKLDSVVTFLESNKFMAKPATEADGQRVMSYDRNFGDDTVSVELKADDDKLMRATFFFSCDKQGKLDPAVDGFIKKFFDLYQRTHLEDVDGIIHANTWNPPRIRQSGDFFLVKAPGLGKDTTARFLFIHVEDKKLNPNTKREAESQKDTDWNKFRQWKDN